MEIASSEFEGLFKKHRGLVRSVVSRKMPNDPDQEDIVQIVFLEVFRSLSRFEGRGPIEAWIVGIAFNVIRHHQVRQRRRLQPVPLDDEAAIADERVSPEGRAECAQLASRTYALLDALSPARRNAFVMNDFLGWSSQRTATVLGVKPATLKTRLFYARTDFWQRARHDPLLAQFVPSKAA